MILVNVTFGTRRRSGPDDLEEIAESYLGALYNCGQLCGEHFLTWTKGRLNAHVGLAGRGATQLRHHSPFGRRALKEVIKAFGGKPVWRILDDDANQPAPSWRDAPFLYLYTHAFDWESPVCRGDGKPPVPVFSLPLTFEQKEQLAFWQRCYRDHDNVWLGSGVLEIPAYRELADPESELAQHGRDLCREIEAATGLPTFYYLARYWGRARGEARRLCPGCGGAWGGGRARETSDRFWQFDFRCDRCRLVSHLGVSTDGGRKAGIGEFRKARRTKQTGRRGG